MSRQKNVTIGVLLRCRKVCEIAFGTDELRQSIRRRACWPVNLRLAMNTVGRRRYQYAVVRYCLPASPEMPDVPMRHISTAVTVSWAHR